MKLAQMIRLYLASNEMDQKAAATQIGISESTLCRFLNGTANPDAVGFMRILSWATATKEVQPQNFHPRTRAG